MSRSIPKQAVDDSTDDYFFSNTSDIKAGSVSTTILKEFFSGEVEYRRSRKFLETSVSPDHNTGYEAGYFFVRTPGAERITEFPRVAGTLEKDVDAAKLEQHYTTTGMYPAYEIPPDGGATWLCDPNFLWDNPGVWYSTFIPATARWDTSWTEFPQGGIDMICAGPKLHRWEWDRKAAAVIKDQTIQVQKGSSQNNYLVSLYSDFKVGDVVLPKGKLIKLTSNAALLTALEETIFVHGFKKD